MVNVLTQQLGGHAFNGGALGLTPSTTQSPKH